MKLIDTNVLLVLILGSIDPKLINANKRTSIYEEQDYYDLVSVIGDLKDLIVLPNVWTETDNLLNNTIGRRKYEYLEIFKATVGVCTEEYVETKTVCESTSLYVLGLTDSLLLDFSSHCEMLITSDSGLSDQARARGVKVFDLVQNRNSRIV